MPASVPGPDARKWDDIHGGNCNTTPHVAAVLIENLHLLPAAGRAVDIACGRGGNAILLAQHGLETEAWDCSQVALDELQKRAGASHVTVTSRCIDVSLHPPDPGAYDVIVVSRFLDRRLAPRISAALRPGGLLFYQTFIRDAVDPVGPSTTGYRLDTNELLRLFPALEVVVYREEGRTGDQCRGWRNEAMLVARKPTRNVD